MVKQHVISRKCANIAGLVFGICSATSLPAQVTQVDYASLAGTQSTSMASIAGGPPPGTNYDSLLVINGVAAGEHFGGQTVTPLGNFDQLGDTATGALTLLPGTPGHNLDVFTSPAGPVLAGLGTLGFPENDAIGEGAVSFLFSSDQSEFGFRLAGGNGGNAYLGFFRDDGSLIQSVTLNNLPLIAAFGFTRDGGIHDIRGVSIWNDDVTGFGITNIRYDVASNLPEPASWAMMLLGFGAIGVAMRRRQSGRAGLIWNES
jgi:catechol 2,3-dioxygenase-like lactoylglutathione lyase family enzyme